MNNNLYYKTLKNTIDNLIDLSENSTHNTYCLCGINNNIMEYFSNYSIAEEYREFFLSKKTKNGIVLDYKGNRIILQKDNRATIICGNKKDFYYNFYNKPLDEFNIIDMNELDDLDKEE